MDQPEFKFQNICRACKIENSEMCSIYEHDLIDNNMLTSLTPADMLMACTSVKVSQNDGMPQKICIKCINKLKTAFIFKKQCEDTDTFLRQCLVSNTVIKTEWTQNNVFNDLLDGVAEGQNNNEIKLEPLDTSSLDNSLLKRRRGRPKKPDDNDDPDLKVILENIRNEGPESSKFETSKRGRLRKSIVKYEEDNFSDSQYDFAEVIDPSDILNDTTLSGSDDPEWTVSDNEIIVKKDITDENNDDVKFTTRKSRGRPKSHDQYSKIYECTECDMKFKSKLYLKQHQNSIHDDQLPFMCEICPEKFARRDYLIDHTKSHLNELNHDCEICGQKLETIEQLAKHKFSKHSSTQSSSKISVKKTDKEKYKCDTCEKLFSSPKHRDNHVYLAHNKIYYCKTCTVPFRGREAFYLHNTRSNECSKKHLCPDCGARFSATSALKVHIRRHRGEKPFKCQYCEKGFSRKFDLITHETRHRGEKNHLCTICGKGFNRRHMLTIHMRTHTGEKPYKCSYCDAAFTQNNDLKTHIRRHTGERFVCDICNEKFLMHYLLSKHKRVVHGINIPPAKPILERVPTSVTDQIQT